MEICPECGRPIRGNGVYAGPHWNRRHYCSNSCCRSGERNLSQDDVVEDNRGCLYRFFRWIISAIIVIVGIFIFLYIESKLSDDDKTSGTTKKTEQSSTQTPKKQSTTTAKNTNSSKTTVSSKSASSNSTTTSSSKPATTQSSGSASNSSSTNSETYSSTTVPSSSSTATSSTSSSATEYDESYQTYLALMTLLADEGESLKLCEAQNKTKGKEANVIGKMSQLRGTKYYNDALNDLLGYCPRYADEYYKNGKYFASEAEFYQAYIAPNYSKTLKAKKKGK